MAFFNCHFDHIGTDRRCGPGHVKSPRGSCKVTYTPVLADEPGSETAHVYLRYVLQAVCMEIQTPDATMLNSPQGQGHDRPSRQRHTCRSSIDLALNLEKGWDVATYLLLEEVAGRFWLNASHRAYDRTIAILGENFGH
jgi:hypothetical protein